MTRSCTWFSSQHFATHRVLLVVIQIVVTGLAVLSGASAGVEVQSASQPPMHQLHPAKQTTLGLYVTARQAYERWKVAPGEVVVLDVRTPEEFMFVGHADMAWNIPVAAQLYQWDADKKQFPMRPLPDFVSRVQKIAKPGDTLMVMCRSGGRSAMAVNQLAAAGFSNVYNITDGMEGDEVKDLDSVFHGQRLVNGWRNSALPWTYDVDPAHVVLPLAR